MKYASHLNPYDIKQTIDIMGIRYTFWKLTEQEDCSVLRAVYLILLSF